MKRTDTKDFVEQIKNKKTFFTKVNRDELKIVKQGINNYSVFFKSQDNKNWQVNCSINAIALILKAWESDKKLIKKYHSFEW